ncbi:MAG TPA: hypothetical protein ENO03_01420, partial [Candidatus Aminicenantes bacterium]|nr:hypothetical protein [Candidatus Aminicenantes bacterium]
MKGLFARLLAPVLAVLLSASCLAHLDRAKRSYAEGQARARAFQTEQAIAHWKRTLDEAGRACRRRPSAQAFTVRG